MELNELLLKNLNDSLEKHNQLLEMSLLSKNYDPNKITVKTIISRPNIGDYYVDTFHANNLSELSDHIQSLCKPDPDNVIISVSIYGSIPIVQPEKN